LIALDGSIADSAWKVSARSRLLSNPRAVVLFDCLASIASGRDTASRVLS
jgi:hypothetical protein